MQIDFTKLNEQERYKLLVNSVVPRPIALVSSMSRDGTLNAAPFSFFNVFGGTPPTVVIGINSVMLGHHKDTKRNIEETGEFVINLVSEDMAEQMNITAVDFAPEVDELEVAGFRLGESSHIKTPYIQESPIAFECKLSTGLDLGQYRHLIIGEILGMQIQDHLINPETLRIQIDETKLIGRTHGRGGYVLTTDGVFNMPRIDPETIPDLIEAAKQRSK